MQVKHNADVYLDRFFLLIAGREKTAKKKLVHLGVHPPVHVAEVFSSPGTARFVHRFGLTRGLAFDLRTECDLNDPAQRANMWSHLQHRKATLDCWELEWTHCWDVTHEVDDGHVPLASCSRTFFFVHQYSGKLFRNAEFCAMKSMLVSYVDGWRTFVTNCEEIHNNLCKLNCRSHVAEPCVVAVILGLRQALTRIGCFQAFEVSGPTVEEPCLAEMADYDRVYYDSVTGASLPSKLCEVAMQLEIKYMCTHLASTEP